MSFVSLVDLIRHVLQTEVNFSSDLPQGAAAALVSDHSRRRMNGQ